MVDRALLERVAVRLGAKNKSDAVHALLAKSEEDDAIFAALDRGFGSIPGFPLDDRP